MCCWVLLDVTLAVDDTDSEHLFIVADVDLGQEEELNTRFRFAFGHAFLFQLSAQINEFVEFFPDKAMYSSNGRNGTRISEKQDQGASVQKTVWTV